MARVLVSGGGGLLGSTLVPHLSQLGHEVVLLSRNGIGHVHVDLTDRKSTFAALSEIAPEVIVNLAALTNVDECETFPDRAYEVNASTVRNLSDWISKSASAAHLIQVSTDQVYDGSGPHIEDEIHPINYYSYSKLLGEFFASKVNATILRTNLFGRSRCAGRASLSDWLVEVLKSNQAATVFDDILFTPLSLDTLAKMLGLTIARTLPGTFNLGSRNGMSKADFAFRLARCLSLSTENLTRTQSQEKKLKARRPHDMRMDCSRFESAFECNLPTLESEINLMRDAYAQ